MKAEKSWHIDSGCSKHMAGNASKIIHISPKDSEICDLWTQQTKPTWSTSPISGIKWYQKVTCLWLITFDDCFLLSLMIFLWLFFIEFWLSLMIVFYEYFWLSFDCLWWLFFIDFLLSLMIIFYDCFFIEFRLSLMIFFLLSFDCLWWLLFMIAFDWVFLLSFLLSMMIVFESYVDCLWWLILMIVFEGYVDYW